MPPGARTLSNIPAREPAVLQKNDVLFAHKALTLVADLSAADRRVAGAIIDHFNKKTGQCDPGNARLADLLGMDARTVRRATSDLCDVYELFSKVSHGGKSHRAAYTPNWKKFQAIVDEWDARMRKKTEPSDAGGNRAELPGSLGRDCPVEQGETALQTLIRNPSNKPIAPYGACGDAGLGIAPRQEEPRWKSQPQGRNGLLRGRAGQPNSRQSRKPQVAYSPSHEAAARAQAEKRLDADLRRLGWQAHSQAIEHMDAGMVEAATRAEIGRPGAGLRLVMDQLGPRMLRSADAIGERN